MPATPTQVLDGQFVRLADGQTVDLFQSRLKALNDLLTQQYAGPKDRGFTISFDNEPYVLSKLTNRKDKLYRSLAGLRAEGSTALYDAIVYGLYQFTGVKGKKAVVILSDGKDTASKFDYDTLLEYVRKSGIAIYAIGCLPVLRKYALAEAVYRTVARTTRGMFLPLREAALLVPLIAGAAASELDKQRLDEHVAALWMENAAALRQSDEPERARWIAEALQTKGVRAREMGAIDENAGPAPLRFRDVSAEDVEGSLERLRLAGRLAA